jgi:hypothetical protein
MFFKLYLKSTLVSCRVQLGSQWPSNTHHFYKSPVAGRRRDGHGTLVKVMILSFPLEFAAEQPRALFSVASILRGLEPSLE